MSGDVAEVPQISRNCATRLRSRTSDQHSCPWILPTDDNSSKLRTFSRLRLTLAIGAGQGVDKLERAGQVAGKFGSCPVEGLDIAVNLSVTFQRILRQFLHTKLNFN